MGVKQHSLAAEGALALVSALVCTQGGKFSQRISVRGFMSVEKAEYRAPQDIH